MPPSKTTSSRNGVHLLSSWPKCSHRTASQAIARAIGCSLQPAGQALSLRETHMSFTQRSWLHAQLEASPLHWLVSVVLGVTLCAGRGEKESLASPCYKPGNPSPAGLVPAHRSHFSFQFYFTFMNLGVQITILDLHGLCKTNTYVCTHPCRLHPIDSGNFSSGPMANWDSVKNSLNRGFTVRDCRSQAAAAIWLQGFLSLLGGDELSWVGCIHTLFFLGPGWCICKMGVQKARCVHGS